MLFRTSDYTSKLILIAATIMLATSLSAAPALAGKKENPWLFGKGGNAGPGKKANQGAGLWRERGKERAAVPYIPAPGQQGKGRRKDRTVTAPIVPAPGRQDGSRRGRAYPAPQPTPPGYGGGGGRDRQYSGGGRDRQYSGGGGRHDGGGYEHGGSGYGYPRHRHSYGYTYNHVHNHNYYWYSRRSYSRAYYYPYYFPYTVAYPVPYPVYAPYHVHTAEISNWHGHNNGPAYCENGRYETAGYSGTGSHATGGTILGGAAGAALGSQFGNGKGKLVAVGVGALVGALIGRDIGHSMDAADRRYATNTMNQALETAPTCTTITWNNPGNGNRGAVMPTRTYEVTPGRYCREFQQQIFIGGKVQDAYGTACRQPDGSWEIVAEQP